MKKEVFEKIWDQKDVNEFSGKYIQLYMDVFNLNFNQLKYRDIIISEIERAVSELEPVVRKAIKLKYGFNGEPMKKSKIEEYMGWYKGKYNDLEREAFYRLRRPVYDYSASKQLERIEREYRSKIRYIKAIGFQKYELISIEDLFELSIRTKALLSRNHITSLGDLLTVSEEKLNSIVGFGKKSMEEVNNVKKRFTFE